jgi:hypothetical protein
MHGDQWPAVAEHVGTHGVLECITHFLQLPIEDDFLDELERRATAAPGQDGDGAGVPQEVEQQQQLLRQREEEEGIRCVPFAGNDSAPGNPLMSVVSRTEARGCLAG